ncbi:MAG: lysine--tRNA ligase [Patescibacteria group bacterium]|jgi:lysyl-tRNA synthetase class 2
MNTQLADDFVGQRAKRIEKLKALRDLGINPYPSTAQKDFANTHVTDNFGDFENKKVHLTGRLMSMREHGKLAFADLVDQSGKIQLFLKQDTLIEELENSYLGWDHLSLFDVGDFVEAHGTVIKTVRGEVSLQVTHLRLLTKSLRPLPNQLNEKELQFRRRYLDLITNPERKELFFRKAKFWQVSREFMRKHGFVEVETPVLEHVTGGADARPFVTHHNDLDQDFYMRISTELYQKRLIGGGFEKVFTLAPNFRNEGTSEEHLQEYYQLEWYWAYVSYRENMLYVRDIIRHTAQEVYGKTKFESHGHTFDLADDWKEIDYGQCITDRFGVDIFTTSDEEMLAILKREKVVLTGAINRNRLIDNLWKLIRKTIAGPAFLINEPKFMSPLAKSKPDKPELTERFHVIIAGSELGNGYSELNDPQDQLERFLDQQKQRDAGDDEAQMLDIDYVEMLEYGMPPTSGYAHSERLFWFLEDVTAREATLFPLMKNEVEELTKKIYPQVVLTESK